MKYVDDYSELLLHKPKKLRDLLRKVGLDGMWAGYRIRHSYRKLFSTPRIQFLYIHHVFRDEAAKLERLLDVLTQDHQFISHSEAVDRLCRGDVDRSYISISSDDGLKNNLRAAEALNKHGISGCFFICPAIVGEKDFEKIRAFTTDRLHFPPVEFLTWEEVEALQRDGHEIGGHTLSHINIARTEEDRLKEEIGDCYTILKERCGGADHFAYPYGKFSDFSGAGRRLAYSSGFVSVSSAQRGCHIVVPGQQLDPHELLIRRDHVILDWPLHHILYFIARNALQASVDNNLYTGLCE